MENKTIEQLLSSIAALVGDARGSLFGQDRCMVDRDQLLSLVDTLQSQLPKEIEEAQTIIENCSALKTNAKKEAAETRKEADRVLQEAQERAAKMIEETTIVEMAKAREAEILQQTEQQRAQLISGAIQYADRIMEDAERTVKDVLNTLHAGVGALQSKCQEDMNASTDKITEARRALQSTSFSEKVEQSES